MEQGTGCAGREGMSKVAEDGRETYALLLPRGRFLPRNRGTQPGTMWWGVRDRVPRSKTYGNRVWGATSRTTASLGRWNFTTHSRHPPAASFMELLNRLLFDNCLLGGHSCWILVGKIKPMLRETISRSGKIISAKTQPIEEHPSITLYNRGSSPSLL